MELLPTASVSPYPVAENGPYHQSWWVLHRAALSHDTDVGVLTLGSQGQPRRFSWQQHCPAATNSKTSSLQGKGKRKVRTPHSVVMLCCNPLGKHSLGEHACLHLYPFGLHKARENMDSGSWELAGIWPMLTALPSHGQTPHILEENESFWGPSWGSQLHVFWKQGTGV